MGIYLISRQLPASIPPPLRSTTPSSRDLFHSEKPSTCFPAYYPPPSDPKILPRKTLVVTQFKLTPSAKNEKSVPNFSVDVPSLTAVFGKISVTTPEADVKAQEHRKCVWAPSSKTPEALPVLSPVTAIMSGSHRNPNSEVVSSVKPISTRRRRIAALPKRHIKASILPTRDPSLPPAANLPIPRTPSLGSDTSSCADSLSSSDELDTPPLTPPSHLPLIACYTSSTTITSSKSNTKGSSGLPICTNPDFPRSGREEGIRIDFTNGETVGEQQFSFSFSA